ncbi:GntR family transcriptional regulator [Marinomonas sp. UCMA 3892]|uniref:GntR family transcriptional regulator n=1 Tax=Marinomonas sp. UCMA 3892 TaxID=1972585 RepID=UPI00146F3043|nr:GntR family transcriptional regulator [Marinomonas sp. UCMA 3892]NLU96630.1 GntR family transcriptional regulator [Marinomonas sp. UCMA 3892]
MSNDENIYRQMLNAIVEHQLPPGARLPEDRLSEAFGVSRTGIRKVLQRLALEHFVIIEKNKGAQVNRPNEAEASEVLDSRILIEPQLIPALLDHWNTEHSERFRIMVTEEKRAEEANQLADSIQLTARFHYELAKLSGNQVLASFVEQLCYRSSLILAAYGTRGSVGCECGDHSQLLDILDQGRKDEAKTWMSHHLKHIKSSLILESKPEENIDFQRLFGR